MIAVPLKAGDRVRGVAQLINHFDISELRT